MQKLLFIAVFALIPAFGATVSAQSNLLDAVYETKEQFTQSEPQAINTINWLENTPINQDVEKRKQQMTLLLAWISNAPTVTVELNEKILPFTKKNPDLLMAFLGGWTKYSLENSYSKDIAKCSLAGVQAAIRMYKKGNGLKKDKAMDKLIKLDDKKELEQWVVKQLGGK